MDFPTLDIDSFVRSIGVNKGSPHALFLGAGASISSGVPSAGTCIWQWKKSIFCTNNPGLEEQVSEVSLPAIQARIDRWLQVNGYVPAEGEDEYSYFIEQCHPIAEDRRRFFEPWIRRARPHIGYRLLCLLAQVGIFKSAWTTNFDGLVARAAAPFDLTAVEVGIDSKERIYRQPQGEEIVCVSLHGDYRYDALKNTPEELRNQEDDLKQALIDTLGTHSLVVSGYSGRDPSVMEALSSAVAQTNRRGKVYWCGISDEPAAVVHEFLSAAGKSRKEVYYVRDAAFDDVMARLARHCLSGQALTAAKPILDEYSEEPQLQRVPFSIARDSTTALIKSNAWPIQCPSEMFEFQLKEWPQHQAWKWLAEKTAQYDVIAVPFRTVLSMGTLDDIRLAFNGLIDGDVRRVPITDNDVRYEDGAVVHLLQRAAIRAIARKRGLETDGHRAVWEKTRYATEREGSISFNIHHAARVMLRRIRDAIYIVLDPTIYSPDESDGNRDAYRNLRLRILGYQHNRKYNDALRKWQELIFNGDSESLFDFPPNSASFTFNVSSKPIFAAVHQANRPAIRLPKSWNKLISHYGVEIREQVLRFSDDSKTPRTDTLPLRGLSNHGPFDHRLNARLSEGGIQIAVICPRRESHVLENFLAAGGQSHDPVRGSKEEYLLPYPGFESIFRTPVHFPCRNDNNWRTLPDIDQSLSEREGALELSREIREGISTLAATGRPVVLVFIPDRWKRWREFHTDSEHFDLHDFTKAYSVQRGIATQFIEEDTLQYRDMCRVWWWLSVALYTKAMRTPWVVSGLDANTAFVGLGYAIDQREERGKHIVLGCSHLYNAQGQGLQFRLSRIDNPIIKGKNAFLTAEDARRLGENIRSLFWESHLRLPSRVVIHKQTPFRRDERQGLRAGLDGIDELELVELNFESALRYVSSHSTNGRWKGAPFPVRRGTVVKLTDHEALLWLHGSTDASSAGLTYYQGKRRIPGPLVVRRHSGSSDLATIANEILGLSKMDWNSGDLYSKLPVTVQSCKRIARIGMLLHRFGGVAYDYRLFM